MGPQAKEGSTSGGRKDLLRPAGHRQPRPANSGILRQPGWGQRVAVGPRVQSAHTGPDLQKYKVKKGVLTPPCANGKPTRHWTTAAK